MEGTKHPKCKEVMAVLVRAWHEGYEFSKSGQREDDYPHGHVQGPLLALGHKRAWLRGYRTHMAEQNG